MRYAVLGLLLVGCTTADPNLWLLYGKASYLYGRIEAKAETHCQVPIAPDRVDLCREAASTQQAVKTMAPLIQAELSKKEPDWSQIMKYVDLVFSLAAKVI
jgi:hypothetical protein